MEGRQVSGNNKPGLGETIWRNVSGIIAPLSFLCITIIALSIIARDQAFMSADNWANIVQSTAVVAILACGETAVIILGHIDLSVGRVLALSAVVSALSMMHPSVGIGLAVLIACGVGALCGLASGLLTAYGRMPAFIASLGIMSVAYGLALLFSGDQNISGLRPGFDMFSTGNLAIPGTGFAIPIPLALMVVVAIAMHLLLSRTAFGRAVYAVGGNKDAARLSGISIQRVTVLVFVVCGFLCGFGSVIHMSRTAGAQPTAGTGMEMSAIAATVIGGTSLAGGSGGIVGTLIGAFLMAVIQNGCDLKGLQPHYQLIITGCVIWLAALYDSMRRRGQAA